MSSGCDVVYSVRGVSSGQSSGLSQRGSLTSMTSANDGSLLDSLPLTDSLKGSIANFAHVSKGSEVESHTLSNYFSFNFSRAFDHPI